MSKLFKKSDFPNTHSFHSVQQEISFINKLKTKWEEIHNETNVFRYKITDLQEKRVEKYLLMLNIDRGSNRRTPEHIVNILQPFDERRFNFTKVSPKEIMYSLDSDSDEYIVIVNVSPISFYHSLLCPSVNKKLPQIATAESLILALEIMFLDQDRELKIVFNSLCGLASVNHLHYHLMLHKDTWPVELAKWRQIKGPLHCIENYPIDAFCFQVEKESIRAQVLRIYPLIQYFLDNSIAHNILISIRENGVAIYVYPRKSAAGAKEFRDFNVAALELSGWITVYSTEAYQNLLSKDLDIELEKWKIDNFDELCTKVQLLY